MKQLPIAKVIPNEQNPRNISADAFEKLTKSVQDLPTMLTLRPLIIDENNVLLGGNMRYKAMEKLGYKTVPTDMFTRAMADEMNAKLKEQGKPERTYEEFCGEIIVKDNIPYGEWDWDSLANGSLWDSAQLEEWGLKIPQFETDVDYSILDGEEDAKLSELEGGVKRAIQIEFEAEHYEEANELVKFWREQKLYIGGFLMEKLKDEKTKLPPTPTE